MSGPIVRKYGFPNFDEIFGKKELQHGVDEPEAGETGAQPGEQAGEKGDKKPEAKGEKKG